MTKVLVDFPIFLFLWDLDLENQTVTQDLGALFLPLTCLEDSMLNLSEES